MINFYVTKHHSIADSMGDICKVLEQLERNGKIFVYTPDAQLTNSLDNALWTYKDDSFVPHTSNLAEIDDVDIFIQHERPENIVFATIVNLSVSAIQDPKAVQNILEFVYTDDLQKQKSREKYNTYKQAGFTIKTFNI